MSTLILPEGSDAFNPDRDDWEFQVEESIKDGDTHFVVDVTTTWEDDDGEFHTEVIVVEFDAEGTTEFWSMYYAHLRGIIDYLGANYETAAFTG